MFKISALLFMLSASAWAGPITWTLQGVTFADGGTASGSFAFDATAGVYSSINITTTVGSVLGGSTYGYPNAGIIGGPSDLIAVASNAADLTGTPDLYVYWATSLTNAGGTIGIASNVFSSEDTCSNANCSTLNSSTSTFRIMTAGAVTTNGASVTPEPATFALVGGALGVFGWKRRSLKSAPVRPS